MGKECVAAERLPLSKGAIDAQLFAGRHGLLEARDLDKPKLFLQAVHLHQEFVGVSLILVGGSKVFDHPENFATAGVPEKLFVVIPA